MSNLNVNLLNHTFRNPVIAASGIYGYGQDFEEFFPLSELGGFVSKATTLHKRNGNDGIRITEIPSGVLFSVGLQNGGVESYIENHLPRLLTKGTNILTNVAGSDVEEFVAVIERLEQTDAPIIELNISCPNVTGTPLSEDPKAAENVVSIVRKRTKKPMTVKLSPNVRDIGEIAKAVESAGADAVSLVNSMPGMKIDIRTRRPLFRNNTAGISGEALFPLALRLVWQTAKAVKIPVIGVGGITNTDEALQMMIAGASAVQIGAASLKNPRATVDIVKGMNEWLDENHIDNIKEIVGSIKPW